MAFVAVMNRLVIFLFPFVRYFLFSYLEAYFCQAGAVI